MHPEIGATLELAGRGSGIELEPESGAHDPAYHNTRVPASGEVASGKRLRLRFEESDGENPDPRPDPNPEGGLDPLRCHRIVLPSYRLEAQGGLH